MTSRQREVLAAMVAGQWMTAAAVASRCPGVSYTGTLRCLWLLEDSGNVARQANEYRRTAAGNEQAHRFELSERVGIKPRGRARSFRRGKSFSEKYHDPEGPRYGQLFMVVRVMRCWLCEEGYEGPGHKVGDCARGVQGGHTAHHTGRLDADGMIPGGGAAHDLYAGLGGDTTQQHFKDWLKAKGVTLTEIGLRYVAKARTVIARGGFEDKDLNW
ncbi:MAG TPA: hypothetical protein VNA25_22610 [Phycisphaerae bacterium]|nr:hypothetical protein [Phycisphaerae bacterium]